MGPPCHNPRSDAGFRIGSHRAARNPAHRCGKLPRFPRGEDDPPGILRPANWRSEEHTSELQSQSNLVCRLLLEKKKTTSTPIDVHCRPLTFVHSTPVVTIGPPGLPNLFC